MAEDEPGMAGHLDAAHAAAGVAHLRRAPRDPPQPSAMEKYSRAVR